MVRRGEVVSEFCDYTSAHGFAGIKRSTSCLGRFIWIVCTLASSGVCAFQMYVAFDSYFQYETITSVRVEYASDADFPAVSFCNLNPLPNISNLSAFGELLTRVDPSVLMGRPLDAWENVSINMNELTFEERLKGLISLYLYNFSDSVPTKGHQLSKMLVECTFQGRQCVPANFTQWQHGTYGNCYTFTLPPRNFPSFVGPKQGLSLTLFTENSVYVQSVSPDAGFRVQIHHKSYIPFPEDAGFTVSTGSQTSVAIKRLRISRLPLPYDWDDCGGPGNLATQPDTTRNQYSSLFGKKWAINYTTDACLKSCYQLTLLKACNCVDASIITRPVVKAVNDIPDDTPPCDFNVTSTLRCQNDEVLRLIAFNKTCNDGCPPACDEEIYLPRITSALWPRDEYLPIMLGGWRARIGKVPELKPPDNETSDEGRMLLVFRQRNCLAKLNIFFEQLEYEMIAESPAMDPWSLGSNAGGILGLYIGMSFLTFVEFLEVIWCFIFPPRDEMKEPDRGHPSSSTKTAVITMK